MPNAALPSRRVEKAGLPALGRFLHYVVKRYLDDGCLEYAASLTFTTLLAFVPMLAITLAILHHFPVFDDIRANLQAFVIDSFMPEAGSAVLSQLSQFVGNTAKLSTFGAVGLAVAVFILLLSIESAFNNIWHVSVPRPIMWRILAFWTVLTLGPILLGISVTLSGYLFATAQTAEVTAWLGPGGRSTALLPPLLEFASFSLLYGTIPNRPIKLRHALIGATVATVLFEILKKGFAFYVMAFPTYQTIYGAMAAIPIILLWVYLAWAVGLFGAVVTASLNEWKVPQSDKGLPRFAPGTRLTAALAVLAELRNARLRGEICQRKTLLNKLDLSGFVVETVLVHLAEARYITRVGKDGWVLAQDLEETTLYDLYTDLNLGVGQNTLAGMVPTSWARRAEQSITSFDNLGRDCMAVRLKELFTESETQDGEVVPLRPVRRRPGTEP